MAVGERPVVRGRHMKALVAALETWEGGARPPALLPAEALRTISSAGGLDWLPVALNLQVTQAIYDGLGPLGADRFFRAQSLESFDGPILQTMVTTAVRMFGLDPASFARWVPRAWHMIFRGVGEWTVGELRPGATAVVLTLAHLPSECADHPVWLRSVSRSLSALFDLARVPGSAELPPRARGGHEAQFELRWSAPSGPMGRPPVT
jgi:hypothetical protein